LLTNEVLEHNFKLRGRAPSVVGGITISVAITITIGRRIWPIIVASKIVPISTIVEIIISNEVHINKLFLSNQRGQNNIVRINMNSITSKHSIIVSILSLKEEVSSTEFTFLPCGALSVCHSEYFTIILSRSFVVAPKVMDIKGPPASESKRFLEEKFSPA
jgi:hypothetical protein